MYAVVINVHQFQSHTDIIILRFEYSSYQKIDASGSVIKQVRTTWPA
jgi:hypothetical protein